MMKNKGFTIVELLVATALFATLTSVTTAIFIQSLRSQRQINSLIAANSNASLTIEQIAREARTGKDFCIEPETRAAEDCLPDGPIYNKLIFTNANDERVEYRSENNRLVKITNAGNPIPVTSDNVSVKRLAFALQGQTDGDKLNPRITIIMQVSGQNLPADIVVDLESTVSARTLQD